MKDISVYQKLKGGLIVSCQALDTEPLHSSFIMSRMAYAAREGGAAGIRANSPEDIREIRMTVDLPIIGLYKAVYEDSEVYITPTMKEIYELMEVKPDIIAIDATNRLRPFGISLEQFFKKIRSQYPDMLFMADCSCYEDGVHAAVLGFDFIGTTLSGYTMETKGKKLPDFELIKRLSDLKLPVIAEGGIWAPEELKQAMDCGAFAAVVGTAITRPREITRRFVNAVTKA